ncbi:hypothetical protein A0H81_07354 [Grifola frondosa]|uniref:Uncharacterized protein n=1 Tax=Grifola frondosa TaxID=5627 RepID=A0A1C7M6X9_GRIFR|nr:hypothetical protein A0H81_07354 [Grifola frondosa]
MQLRPVCTSSETRLRWLALVLEYYKHGTGICQVTVPSQLSRLLLQVFTSQNRTPEPVSDIMLNLSHNVELHSLVVSTHMLNAVHWDVASSMLSGVASWNISEIVLTAQILMIRSPEFQIGKQESFIGVDGMDSVDQVLTRFSGLESVVLYLQPTFQCRLVLKDPSTFMLPYFTVIEELLLVRPSYNFLQVILRSHVSSDFAHSAQGSHNSAITEDFSTFISHLLSFTHLELHRFFRLTTAPVLLEPTIEPLLCHACLVQAIRLKAAISISVQATDLLVRPKGLRRDTHYVGLPRKTHAHSVAPRIPLLDFRPATRSHLSPAVIRLASRACLLPPAAVFRRQLRATYVNTSRSEHGSRHVASIVWDRSE